MADVWVWQDSTAGYTETDSYTTYEFWGEWEADESFTCTKIGIYAFADPENNPRVRLGIYSDSGDPDNQPENLLASGDVITIDGTGWYDCELDSPVSITNGTRYHIGHITNDEPTTQWRYRNTSPSEGSPYRNNQVWPTLFDPAIPDTQSSSRYGAYRAGYAEVSPDQPPTITNWGDENHYPGESGVVVTGTNFLDSQDTGSGLLGNDPYFVNVTSWTPVTINSWSDTSINTTIPADISPNSEGTLWMYVVNNSGLYNSGGFEGVVQESIPSVTTFGYEYYYPGFSGVVITGTNFGTVEGTVELGDAMTYTGSTNKTTLTINSWSDTSINATIPSNLSPNSEGTLWCYVTHDNDNTNSLGTASGVIKTEWGLRYPEIQNTTVNWWRQMGGTSPDVDNMTLESVRIYVGTAHTTQARVAVYQGGTLSDPTGATLLEDLGQTTGSATDEWLTLTSSGNPTIVKNTPTWLAMKSDGGFDVHYDGTTPVECDFQQARGRCAVLTDAQDPTVAYPSSISTYDSFGDYWYSIYLDYSTEAGEPIPIITNWGDELHEPDEPDVIVTGTNFLSSQGTGSGLIGNWSTFDRVTKWTPVPINTWSDTSLDTAIPADLSPNSEGEAWMYVVNDSGLYNSTGYAGVIKTAVATSGVDSMVSGGYVGLWNDSFTGTANSHPARLGMYNRDSQYVGEILAYFNLSSYNAEDIDDASLSFHVNSSEPSTTSQTVFVRYQNKLDRSSWSDPPVYDDFPASSGWDTEIGQIPTVLSEGTYTLTDEDSSGKLLGAVKSWASDDDINSGIILECYHGYFGYWLNISGVWLDLVVSGTAQNLNYNVNFSHDVYGKIIGDENQVIDTGEDTEPVTAVETGIGYCFDGWIGDDTSITNPLTFTSVTEHKTTQATFGKWNAGNTNYWDRVKYKKCYLTGQDVEGYERIACQHMRIDGVNNFSGIRQSRPGTSVGDLSLTQWKQGFKRIFYMGGGGVMIGMWNISGIDDNNCDFEFPGSASDPNITFQASDWHEDALSHFDTMTGVMIFLGLELGQADPVQALEVALDQYSHHPCVSGIIIDLEWWTAPIWSQGNYDTQLPVATGVEWLNFIKTYDSGYKLLLRHPYPWILPTGVPHLWHPDVWAVCDDQGYEGYDYPSDPVGTGDFMLLKFRRWADEFYPNTVIFQVGYSGVWAEGGEFRGDEQWYRFMDDPVYEIPWGIKYSGVVNLTAPAAYTGVYNGPQDMGIIWVDFTFGNHNITGPLETGLFRGCLAHTLTGDWENGYEVAINAPINTGYYDRQTG